MKCLYLLIISALVTNISYADNYSKRKWKCTDKNGGSAITSMPCPVGMISQEVDSNNNIIPNGYDPKANKQYWRCTSSIESIGKGGTIYSESSCRALDPLNLMKYKSEQVNREGFTSDEAIIEAKRRENLAKQKEWEKGNNYLPVIDFNNKNTREILLRDQKGFDPIKDKQQEECRSWKNSNVLDPTPEKKKFIEENCK